MIAGGPRQAVSSAIAAIFLPSLVLAQEPAVPVGSRLPLSYVVERAGEPAGSIVVTTAADGWVRYEDRRGGRSRTGALLFDASGAIARARFESPEGGAALDIEVTDGKVALGRGEERHEPSVPLLFRPWLKAGEVFVILETLQPAVLLGSVPGAVTSSRPDTEVGAIVVDPAEGVKGSPRFRPLRFERERKPRKVELADGRTVDAVALVLSMDKVRLMTVIAGKDGVVYAYRIEAKDSPRYGETGRATIVK